MRFPNRADIKRSHIMHGLSLLGLLIMAYLTWVHYSPVNSSLCNLSPNFSCDVVNKSVFSEFLGLPISILGILFFLSIMAIPLLKNVQKPHALIALIALFNVPFALSLTGVEIFYLGSICVFCEISKMFMLGILALAVKESHSRGHRLARNHVLWVLLLGAAVAAINYRLLA
ncbi:hypothetical protein HY633_01390 [Candidatus Uhrbacteria bacterium]|nr:hypothetical protein [Candidatus Uhrbacteria bacterium]